MRAHEHQQGAPITTHELIRREENKHRRTKTLKDKRQAWSRGCRPHSAQRKQKENMCHGQKLRGSVDIYHIFLLISLILNKIIFFVCISIVAAALILHTSQADKRGLCGLEFVA